MPLLIFSILSCAILICNGNIANKLWKRNSKESNRDVKAPRGFPWFPDYASSQVVCEEGYFHCSKDGNIDLCIPPHWLCDGWHDCPGSEDETNCNICEENYFHCDQSADICIPDHQICDGWHDCPGSEDELGCSTTDCGGMYNNSSGTIDYPPGRVFYENNVHCEWHISVELGERVNISFTLFETEALYDNVTISEEGMVNATFSGHRNFTTWVSETNNVSITFESDSLVFGQGFILNWNSFPSGITTTVPSTTESTTLGITTTVPSTTESITLGITTTVPSTTESTTLGFHICQHIEVSKCEIPGVKLHCPEVCLGFP